MGKLILVVEDDRSVTSCLEEIFSSLGHETKVAFHGAAGLELLTGGLVPDLIILDHRMPVMDGEEFLRELARVSPDVFRRVPVILFTVMRAPPVSADAKPGLRYLNKMAELSALVRAAQEALSPTGTTAGNSWDAPAPAPAVAGEPCP